MAQQTEFERIAEITRRLYSQSADIVLGIGDDAAVLAPSPEFQVLSVDAQVEDVHFARNLLPACDIGYRAFVAAISDLAAMGARPRAALVSLIVPTRLSDAELYEVIDGIAEAARGYACPVIGGNLARGPSLSITTTVIGSAAAKVLTRAGSRAGDGLFIVGETGSAAVGLALLQVGHPELGPHCVARWRRPEARVADGAALRGLATSAIDVSDGLLQDAGHVAEASGVGFEIQSACLPMHPDMGAAAMALGEDPLHFALTGGEDYGLLFTLPDGVVPPVGVRIGSVTQEPGLRLWDASGNALPLPSAGGFDHFR